MKCRFLYDNLITSGTSVTVSSLRSGIVTSALKDGTGSAVLTTSGNFSGSKDLEYIIEIDSVVAGVTVGFATYKWSDGSGAWDSTGVTTASGVSTLNNGVNISFSSGTSPDFIIADTWYLKGINLFNTEKMVDWNRDSRYRSAGLNTYVLETEGLLYILSEDDSSRLITEAG